MSKKRIVEIIDQSGNNYGQINDPADFIKSQEFAHQHVEQLTQDFLTNTNSAEIAGCDYELTNGLNIKIKSGRIYQKGIQHEIVEKTVILAPAHPTYTRIDLVIATLASDVPANVEFLAFQQIRTEQEFVDSLPPYPPTQFQRATERHNLGTISVKTGIASVNPVAPTLAANEILLYTVTLPSNSILLENSNIFDSRRRISNIGGLNQNFDNILARLLHLEEQTRVLAYRYPSILSADGKCPARLSQDDNNQWVIDIPVGVDVQFGDGFVKIRAENFIDPDVFAQYTNVSSDLVTYQPLFEFLGGIQDAATTGNIIRFTVPATTKTLYINRQGQLIFKDITHPSNPTECILMKITPSLNKPPILKTYRNLRNSITNFSGTKTAQQTITFEMSLGQPVSILYVYAYAQKAADQTRYSIPLPNIIFDGTVTVVGVADGDKWNIDFYSLSAL